MSALVPVPEEIAHTAALALTTRAERGGGTARSLVIATALTTGFVTEHEVGEIRDWHDRHPDAIQGSASTLLAGLYGGAPARDCWPPLPAPPEPEPVTAAVATPLATKLAKLSATVNRSDRQVMLRLHTAATVALNEALRRAPEKMATKARTKAARAALDASRGVYTPAVLAAVGVTEQELLDKRFDTFATYAAALIAAAERRKLLAAARALALEPAEVEDQYGAEIDRRAVAAATMMVASLGLLARSALSGHGVTAESAVGEFSGPVPFGIIRSAMTVASRGASAPFVDETGPGPAAIDELSAKLTDIGSTLVQDLLAANDVPTRTIYSWSVGDPMRPFEPHQALDGLEWTDDADPPAELLWDSGEFPYVDRLEPGDHEGCLCLVYASVEPAASVDSGDASSTESASAE